MRHSLNILRWRYYLPKLFNYLSIREISSERTRNPYTIETQLELSLSTPPDVSLTNNYPSMLTEHNTIGYRYIFTAFPFPSSASPDLIVMKSSNKTIEIRTFRQEKGFIPSVLGPFLGLWGPLYIVTPCTVTLSQKAGFMVQKIDNSHILINTLLHS